MSSDENYAAHNEEPDPLDMMFVGAFGDPAELPEQDPFVDFFHDIQNVKGTPEQRKRKIRALLDAMDVVDTDWEPALNWEQYLDENVDDSYDWLVKDFLERLERVICVAAEGVGKTMLMRQLAICLAAGIHPFLGNRLDRKLRTLSVDCENPPRIIQRKSRKIMEIAKERMQHAGPIEAYLKMLPSGLNLLKAHDRKMLEALIRDVKPDILFMGPLYKCFIDPGGRSSESIATEIAMFYDYLRMEYGCALWLEQHAPLGNGVSGRELRPFGSAVWSRWPEFGINIAKDPTDPKVYKFGMFRGARDQRDFPETAHRGGPMDFPFVVDSFIQN